MNFYSWHNRERKSCNKGNSVQRFGLEGKEEAEDEPEEGRELRDQYLQGRTHSSQAGEGKWNNGITSSSPSAWMEGGACPVGRRATPRKAAKWQSEGRTIRAASCPAGSTQHLSQADLSWGSGNMARGTHSTQRSPSEVTIITPQSVTHLISEGSDQFTHSHNQNKTLCLLTKQRAFLSQTLLLLAAYFYLPGMHLILLPQYRPTQHSCSQPERLTSPPSLPITSC